MTHQELDRIVQEAIDIPSFGKKNIILDATMLTTLMACPRLFDFRFNHHLQQLSGKSNSMECGSIVHKFLEIYYRCRAEHLKPEQCFQFGIAAAELYIRGCPTCTGFIPTEEVPKPPCNHKPNDYPGVKNTPKDSENYKTGWQYVLDSCDAYIQRWRNDHWESLETEVTKGKVLYEDDEIRIMWKAKLDWVADTNQGIFSVDHKTMKQRRDTISMNNQFMGQSLIMNTNGVYVNKFGFQASLKPEDKFTRHFIPYSNPRLLEWQSETLPYYAKLLLMYAETGHFPPNFTECEGKYGNCSFLKVCEGNPDDRERLIKLEFVIGPEWDPSNDED